MVFKAKLRKIGSTQGIYIPTNVITQSGFKIGDVITFDIMGKGGVCEKTVEPEKGMPTKKKFSIEWCKKHSAYKGTCSCE
jgi:antitoxin component of MazEF toxin-antitoxin module